MGPDISDYAGVQVTSHNSQRDRTRHEFQQWLNSGELSDEQCGDLSLVLIIPFFLGMVYVLLSAIGVWFLLVPITILIVKYYRTIYSWIRTVL